MLVTQFPQQLPEELPPGVRHFSYLPFSQIMPRCAAIVYPGGIGTMAQAIKAGIPHLIVPHGHDQPDHAFRIKRLGSGSTISPERNKALLVSRELAELIRSAEVGNRCAEFGKQIDSTTHVERTCDLIEGLAVKTRALLSEATA